MPLLAHWASLGQISVTLGSIWAAFRALLGGLGALWAALGVLLGRSWGVLGASWAPLGPLGRNLDATWKNPRIWDHLIGHLLGSSWATFSHFFRICGAS